LEIERTRHEFRTPGKSGPAIFAFYMPKASALKFHQSNGSQLDNALLALRKDSRVLRHRRAFADCFGANPVASALGNRPRRDPGAAVRTYHEGLKLALKTGTFYLAGNRNFLFGSDSEWTGPRGHYYTLEMVLSR
jgi:hypothetical protein